MRGQKPSWIKRTIAKVAFRALKFTGLPLRDPALVKMFGYTESFSGVHVDEDTALNYSSVWSAVSLIAGAQSILPINVYKRDATSDTDNIERGHLVQIILNASANQYTTAYAWRETMQMYACTWGNAYSKIEKVEGKVVSLWLIKPQCVEICYRDDGSLYYHVSHDDGSGTEDIEPEDMIHIAGMSTDGIKGESVVGRARQSIGLGIATEKYGASFFGNGATPRQVITHPGELSDKAIKNLRKSWRELYSNSENPHNLAILEEGMTMQQIGLPPDDAQFLQTRKFSISEIARWFRVPPYMLYDVGGMTFNNTEQQGQNFLTYTLQPWVVRWIQELSRKLFTEADHKLYYLDFDPSALLTTDTVSRYNAYAQGRNGGWLSLNDILRKEKMQLLKPEVGDTHIAPSTMRTLEANDPSQPVDVEIINNLWLAVQTMSTKAPVDAAFAASLVNAAIPSADKKFVEGMVKQMRVAGYVQ